MKTGIPTHFRFSYLRFEKGGRHRYLDEPDVYAVRKLLRTNMSVSEIAKELNIGEAALRRFIKLRNLCDIKERTKMISAMRLAGSLKP